MGGGGGMERTQDNKRGLLKWPQVEKYLLGQKGKKSEEKSD